MEIRFIRTKQFVQRHRELLKQESMEKEFKTKLNNLQKDETSNNNNNVSDIADFEKSSKSNISYFLQN